MPTAASKPSKGRIFHSESEPAGRKGRRTYMRQKRHRHGTSRRSGCERFSGRAGPEGVGKVVLVVVGGIALTATGSPLTKYRCFTNHSVVTMQPAAWLRIPKAKSIVRADQ